MIRLGSLAGYAFEGPRTLAGWTPPKEPAVYAILTKSKPEPSQEFSVIYVGHADDLSQVGFPFKHARTAAWLERAGGKFNLHVCWLNAPGSNRSHREQITRDLASVYNPSCNEEKFDKSWKAEWIGTYDAPVTDPLTTGRKPN